MYDVVMDVLGVVVVLNAGLTYADAVRIAASYTGGVATIRRVDR